MKQTGEKLRTVRENKGLSIHEISLSLKINSKVLKAIEEGDTTNLPAKTFLRGFVQSYASYLNMDVPEILAIFHEEMGSTRPQPILTPTREDDGPSSATSSEPNLKNETAVAIEKVNAKNQFKAIIISGIMVLLALLIYTVNSQVERYTKEAQIVDSPTDEDTDDFSVAEATSPAKEASKHLLEGKTSVNEPPTNSALEVNTPPPISTTTSTTTSKPVDSETKVKPKPAPATVTPPPVTPPAATVTATATPATTTTPVVTAPPPTPPTLPVKKPPTATPAPVANPAPIAKVAKPAPATIPTPAPLPHSATTATAPPPPPPASANVELIVEALEPLEIQYSTNTAGATASKILLKAAQVHTFKSKQGLTLNLSNAGAANLILNGKDLGVPGKQGQTIQLKY